MGLKYLRRQDKENLLFLLCFEKYLSDTMENWERMKIPNSTKGRIKTIKTHLKKTVKMILDELDKDYHEVLNDHSKKYGITILPTKEARRELEKINKDLGNPIVLRDDLDDLCEASMHECIICKRSAEEASKCELKKLFLR